MHSIRHGHPAPPRESVDWFKRVTDIATLLVLCSGIYFGVDQAGKLREAIDASRDAIDAATYNDIATQLLDVGKTLVEHPELYKYIYGGEPPPTDQKSLEYARAYAMGDMVLNFIDNYTSLEAHLIPKYYDLNAWHKYIEDTFSNSPIICQVIQNSKSQYGRDLVAIAEKRCRKGP